MKNKTKFLTIGMLYVAYWTGFAILDVGEMPSGCDRPFEWWLPIEIFIIFALPLFIGYLIGKNDD